MKKILLIAAVALFGSAVNAQETRFGVKAGYSFSTLKVDEAQDDLSARSTDPSHTFYVGGLVEHKFSDKFGIQGELLYSPLGGKEDYNVSGDDQLYFREKTKITLGTVLVPISAKYFITERFSVAAGLNFGIILSAKQKTVLDSGLLPGMDLEGDNDVDIKDDVNTLNLAPFAGVEFSLENGLFFDARYNMGVSDLSKHAEDGKVTNSFAQIGVGFRFGSN